MKECCETESWLSVFHDAEIITGAEFEDLHAQCGKIRKILIASINTAKKAADEKASPKDLFVPWVSFCVPQGNHHRRCFLHAPQGISCAVRHISCAVRRIS